MESTEHLEFVDVCVIDLVATVSLRRPPVNALSAPMMREIARVFTALSRSTSAAVAILTAPGDRVFCAGADIGESDRRGARQPVRRRARGPQRVAGEARPTWSWR
jgi:enoyl-CoA hydratase